MNTGEQRRAWVSTKVLVGELTISEAALMLGLSERSVWRLKRRFSREGPAALGEAANAAGVHEPIAVISPNLSAIELISAWRDAERKLAGLPPRSEEARSLRLTIDAYRRAYQATFKERHNRSS